MNHRPVIAIVAALQLTSCAAPELTIGQAWIRTPPPGTTATAAYFRLDNKSAETVTLVAATSDSFDSVTIHESRVTDGIWTMAELSSLPIGAGAGVSFQPGGLHLMMTKPKQTIEQGQPILITLEFAAGNHISLMAFVRDTAP